MDLANLKCFLLIGILGGVCSLHAQVPEASAKWEKDILAFEAEDLTHAPPAGAVLFVGSSSIRLWTNLTETFPHWRVVRRGFGGAYLRDVNAYFDRLILPYRPSKVILYAGENDLSGGLSPETVFNEFTKFAVKLRHIFPDTKLYFLSMKPSPSRWFLSPQITAANERIKNYARWRPNITYIDVASPLLSAQGPPDPSFFLKDQLHLNGKGYELWAKEIRRAVKD